jgi:RecA-family ATPase
MFQDEKMETTITKTDNIETVTSTNNNVESEVEAVTSTTDEKINYFVQPQKLKDHLYKVFPTFKLDCEFDTDANFITSEVKETEWLIQNFIPQHSSSNNKVVLWQAKPGIGKTLISSYIAILISLNKRLFKSDYFKISNPEMRPVFILEMEEGLDNMHKMSKMQFEGLVADGEVQADEKPNVLRWCSEEMFYSTDGSFPVLEAACKLYKPCLIILDSVTELSGLIGVDMNSSMQYLHLISPLRQIAKRYNTTLMFLSHPNKANANKLDDLSVSGTFAQGASAKCIFNLSRNGDDDLLLQVAKNNYIASSERNKVYVLEQTKHFTFNIKRSTTKEELKQETNDKRQEKADKRKAMFDYAYILKHYNNLSWEAVTEEINTHEEWLNNNLPYISSSFQSMLREYYKKNPKPVVENTNVENTNIETNITNNTTNNLSVENTNIINNNSNHYNEEKSSIANNVNADICDNVNADICDNVNVDVYDDKSDYTDNDDHLDDGIVNRCKKDVYNNTYTFKDKYLLRVGDVLDIKTHDTMMGNVYNNDVVVCEVNPDSIVLETSIGEKLVITKDIAFEFTFNQIQVPNNENE